MLRRELQAAIGLHIARRIGLPVGRLTVERLAIAGIGLVAGRIALGDRLAQLIQDAEIDGDGTFAGDHLLGGCRCGASQRCNAKPKATQQPPVAKKRSVHGRPLDIPRRIYPTDSEAEYGFPINDEYRPGPEGA